MIRCQSKNMQFPVKTIADRISLLTNHPNNNIALCAEELEEMSRRLIPMDEFGS